MIPVPAKRLKKLPPYLFQELAERKKSYKGSLIDLGEGSPDLPPDPGIIERFVCAVRSRENHGYPNYAGLLSTRAAIAEWYKKRFNVHLDPEREVSLLIGSKEGIAHLFWALCGPGDTVAIPDPAYPVYRNQSLLVGARLKVLPLKEENNFLPQLERLKGKIKLVCLNYPNNPTGACAPKDFFAEVVDLAQRNGFFLFNDNAYSEIYFSSPPPSILEIPGAKEVAVEFNSFSKTFNMAGWRLGFVVGNQKIISALLRIKENVDSGPFNAIQEAAIYALSRADEIGAKTREVYKRRQEIFFSGIAHLDWNVQRPQATFYVWAKVPRGKDSLSFATSLLNDAGVLCAPGRAFGKYGEGYVRFSLTQKEEEIKECAARIEKLLRR